MKKRIFKIIFLLIAVLSFSKEYQLKDDFFDIKLSYDEVSRPGEVFFVRMNIKTSSKRNFDGKLTANAKLVGKNTISKADFYKCQTKLNKKNKFSMLVGLPTWSWQKTEDNTKIQITIFINNEEKKSFSIPVTLEDKKYPHEKIHLNSSLTNLISKPSPEKKEQSRILNELIQTINPEGIYETTGFIRPTTGTRITSEFGQTRTFIYNNGKESPSYHAGLDFGIPTGTEIIACGRGKVVMATWRIVTGYSVIIEHLPGLYSIYYHLSELKCKEGDIVEKGDLIALSGATGLATGPHLHWEIRLNTVCVEPDSLVRNYGHDIDSNKIDYEKNPKTEE